LLALLVQKYLLYSRAEPRAVHQLLAEEVSKSKYYSTSKESTLVLVK
jgi:hypothetical protein